ncbi:unnamed protein product [Caenorhabditis sp. 36 PRJEB53466]|nr:unnamed protein product [Caenorhabditis sp. 36 PRJEB53466]
MSMDQLLKADEQPFVSQPVMFRNFLYFGAKSIECRQEQLPCGTARESFVHTAGIDASIADKFLNTIDVSNLSPLMFNIETDEALQRSDMTSQKILIEESSRRRNAQYKSIALRSLRHDHIDLSALARKSPYLTNIVPTPPPLAQKKLKPLLINLDVPPLLDYNKLIISVSIYLGYTRELEYHEIRLGRLMKVTDRIELTGENTLEDLRNSFSCPADYAFIEDFSEKKPTIDDFAKNLFPSNMFFIHGTFFVDETTGRDPSENIRVWAEKRNNVGPMDTMPMSTKLGDLTARLGQPYVFVHQGVCEHLVVFNDLFIRDESHDGVVFPRRLIERNFRRIACDLCKEEAAKWMVLEHEDLLPNSPGYVCASCYNEYCFDVTGKKVSSFKAVPYCDRKEIGDGGKFISELRFEKRRR